MNSENSLCEEYKRHRASALQDPESKYYWAYVDSGILQTLAEREGKRFLGALGFPSSDNAIAAAKQRMYFPQKNGHGNLVNCYGLWSDQNAALRSRS
jgi:5'-3' exonuclease